MKPVKDHLAETKRHFHLAAKAYDRFDSQDVEYHKQQVRPLSLNLPQQLIAAVWRELLVFATCVSLVSSAFGLLSAGLMAPGGDVQGKKVGS